MSDFFKKFLLEDPPRTSSGGRYVALAAFGKHPGWDDHVEDLGLETESLNFAKTVLYVKGIGGQVDSGAWEKLDAAQQLPNFNHIFVWQRSGQILVGRLWSSSDGKGRTRYPMVICLHFVGVTLGWALKRALPALAELAEGCVQTTSAEDVRGLLARKRAALREACQSTDLRGEYAFVSPEVLHRILQPSREANREGFFRVLYQIQSQLGAFASGKFNGRANPAAIRAQQIRVPAAGENAEQALLFWSRFFLTQLDASVPLLLTLPLEAGWVDVTVGEPGSQEFFCLRASPKAVPMVSEVPYTLDDEFRAKAAAFLDAFQRGETTVADLQPAAAVPPVGDAQASAKGGWRTWFGVGAVVIIGAVAALVWLPKGGKQQAAADASGTRSEATNPVTKAEVAAADATKLKTEAEAPAKEKERQVADASQLAMGKETIVQKNLAEQKYQTAVKEGQAAFDQKDYAQAMSQASVALETKAKDPAATKLLADAQRQLDLIDKTKMQEQKYQSAMKEGQAAFDRKEYAEAITQAGAALETKAKDPAATKLSADARQQLDLVNKTKVQEQKFQSAMKEGQAAFARKEYAEAITQAGAALETKANDPAATKLSSDARQQLDLVNKTKVQEQKYQSAMKEGQAAFGRKEYAEAIIQGGAALETKAKDPAAVKLITDARQQLDLVNKMKAQEQKYQSAIKDGQAAFDRADYAEAMAQAIAALETRAQDPAATKLKTDTQRQLDLVNTAKAQEQQRKATEAAAAKKKADDQTQAKVDLTAAAAAKTGDPKPAAGSPRSGPPMRSEITNSIGMVLVPLPSGIWVGRYEVTQAEYRKVMKSNPSKSVNDRQPVEQVAWNDAKEFCRRLTEMERGKLPAGQAYTLPTEKQWTEFLGGQRFEDLPGRGLTGKGAPAVVGQSGPANQYGLFDVLGNVWEWCLDDAARGQKVLKGGAFNSTNSQAALLPDKQASNCGFRCVLGAP